MRTPARLKPAPTRLIGSTAVAATLILALSACGVTGTTASTAEATTDGPLKNIQVMIPNAPGSG